MGYPDPRALWRRSGLGRGALERLAEADAFRSMGLDRRRALWALKALGEPPLPLFAAAEDAPHPPADAGPPLSPSYGEGRGEGRGARHGAVARDAAGRACRRGLCQPQPDLEAPSARLSAPGTRKRGSGHCRRTRPSAGRPAACDRRGRVDPPAPGQCQRCGLHHHRGRNRDRQFDRLAANPRTLPPCRTRRDPVALHRQIATRGERHPCRRRPSRRPDPAAQHIARPHRRGRAPATAQDRLWRSPKGCRATMPAISSSPAETSAKSCSRQTRLDTPLARDHYSVNIP